MLNTRMLVLSVSDLKTGLKQVASAVEEKRDAEKGNKTRSSPLNPPLHHSHLFSVKA